MTPDFPPSVGGIQTLLLRLVERLDGWEHHVVARRADGAPPAVRSTRTRVAGGPGSIIELNARAARIGRAWRPDVVLNGHVHTTLGALGACRRGASMVTYGFADELTHRPALTRLAARRSAAMISISEYTTALLQAHQPAGPVALVLPGLDPPRSVRVRSDRPVLLTVSRLADRYKGHDVVLDAMPRVVQAVPDVVWHVLGDGPLKAELEQRRDVLGLREHVRFAGYVDDAARDAALGSAWAFVMPSRLPDRGAGGEGFGIVYLEAAAAGVPVVAGNVAGALDAVDDGRTGFLVDPTCPDAIADALITLLTDRGRADAMGEAGRTWASTFTWERMAREVDEVLQAALERTIP